MIQSEVIVVLNNLRNYYSNRQGGEENTQALDFAISSLLTGEAYQIMKIRDICKEHHSCYDNCPFHVDHECVLGIPPANWSGEDMEIIGKALKGDKDE